MATLHCRSCGTVVPLDEPIPRDAECASCGHDLRSCFNCRHYDPAYNNACRETMADPVEDKHRRNFCEFFYFSREAPGAAAPAADRQVQARARLEQLFGGGPRTSGDRADAGAERSASGGAPRDRAQDAREKLDRLFGKKPGNDPA